MLQDEIERRGKGNEAVALHLADFRRGLESAIGEFRCEIYSSEDLWRRIGRRSCQFLRSTIPDEYVRFFKEMASWKVGPPPPTDSGL
jgi:hypothetical protein